MRISDWSSDVCSSDLVQVNATGAATAHALETARGRMDFFMSSPTVHAMMMQGTAMYAKITDAKELSTKLRGVFNFPPGYYHIVVYADSGDRKSTRLNSSH